jgi:uncharacterized membrane protein (UPF0127 family)
MKLFFIRNKNLISIFLFLFIAECNSSTPGDGNTWTIEVGNRTIQVEIADSPQEWELGLSYRDTLAEDHGMLFVFPDESRRVFWMRGCNFDIDIAYIESNGAISEIITMEKESLDTPLDSLTRYPSQSTTIKYVLEMIGGWFEEHDVNIGTIINLSQFSN